MKIQARIQRKVTTTFPSLKQLLQLHKAIDREAVALIGVNCAVKIERDTVEKIMSGVYNAFVHPPCSIKTCQFSNEIGANGTLFDSSR